MLYQHLRDTVYPIRLENKREVYKTRWWIFAEPRPKMRATLNTLSKRYIATPYTAKFRPFVFVDVSVLPDAMAYAIALEDAYHLGVLSSRIHEAWCKEAGGTLEDRQRYNSSQCFDPFPFPTCTPAQQAKIRALGEQLDAHRKRQQALHPELTMTGMYNVLERVRAIERLNAEAQGRVAAQRGNADAEGAEAPLNAKEKAIYEHGLVGILKQLHDELDAAVAEAYGWPAALFTDEILTRLVALNAERAAEEAKGTVRWLRPEYQNAGAGAGTGGKQATLDVDDAPAPAPTPGLKAWPDELPAQAAALTEVLAALSAPADVEAIAAHFEGKRTKKRVEEMTKLLETLKAVGRAGKSGSAWQGS